MMIINGANRHGWLVVAAMAGGLLAVSVASGQSSEGKLIRQQTVTAQDGSTHTVEHWRLSVPEERTSDSSKTISLAFVRIKAPSPTGEPPIVFLAGGPGGSGIRQMTKMVINGGNRLFELVGGDIIGLDQRGVGLSEPNLETETTYETPIEFSETPEDSLARVLDICRAEGKRWREKGVNLSAYNTIESADDVNAVRQALGYPQVCLWGSSYGTHLAMAVMRRHEPHVARALLVSPEGPDQTQKLPSDATRSLEMLAEMVAQNEQLGAQLPDMLTTLQNVLSDLDRQHVSIDVDGTAVKVGKRDVQGYIAERLSTLRRSAEQLPDQILAMSRGDFEGVAREIVDGRRNNRMWSAMNVAMDCASGASAGRRKRIEREAKSCLLGDTINAPLHEMAKALGVTLLPDSFRSPLRTEIPVLMVTGDFDYRTPVRHARELMQQMPNADLVVVKNAGHGDLPMGLPALRKLWGTFLRTGERSSTTVEASPITFGARITRPNKAASKPPAMLNDSDVTLKDLEACVGVYEFADGATFTVRVEQGIVIGTVPGKGDFPLTPTSPFHFESGVDGIPPLTFTRNTQGEVDGLEGGGRRALRRQPTAKSAETGMNVQALELFTGRYDYGSMGFLTISRRGSRLYAQFPGQRKMEVSVESPNNLRWLRSDAQLVIERDENGAIVAGVHHQHGKQRRVTKVE